MAADQQFPEQLGGKRDFDYITPKGRRLTEYEAVTCYTQPSVHGGGLQAAGDFQLCPDGRPLFDLASTRLRCEDWFAYRDPNQMWQRTYYEVQAGAEKSIERATTVASTSGTLAAIDPSWLDRGVAGIGLPFGHYEYGLFRALNMAAREALSDTINNVLAFNAADKLRHAQAIALLSLDLESVLDGFVGTGGKGLWLEDPCWQPLRRLVEEAMAIKDWCEIIVAVDLVIEPLIGEPMRRLVLQLAAAEHRDLLLPVIAGTATADWHRNAAAISDLLMFLLTCPGGETNHQVLTEWAAGWRARAVPVAEQLFQTIQSDLDKPGLQQAVKVAGEEESRRVGADRFDSIPAGV